MTTKANLVKGSSHKKSMSINLIIIIIIILSPMITIPICSNPNPIIFKKRKSVLCVANLATMHLNVEIEKETTILLKLR